MYRHARFTPQPAPGVTRLQPPKFEPVQRSPVPPPQQPSDGAVDSAAAAVVSLTSTAVSLGMRVRCFVHTDEVKFHSCTSYNMGVPLGALITPLPSDLR